MQSDKNKFYVYIHIKPGTDEVFYVGKGKKYRAYKKQGRNPYWNNVVNKYKGFDVTILEDNLNEEESFELEIYWIEQFKAWNFKLTNLSNGGEGPSGMKQIVSEETKNKIRETLTGTKRPKSVSKKAWNTRRKNGNDKASEEQKKKVSEKLKGENGPSSKLTSSEVDKIIELYSTGLYTHRTLSKSFGVHKSTVTAILTGRNWKQKQIKNI